MPKIRPTDAATKNEMTTGSGVTWASNWTEDSKNPWNAAHAENLRQDAIDEDRHADAEEDSHNAADRRERPGFDEELGDDIELRGPRGRGGCRSRGVRSVTDASMMFMIPMPPTRSEMAAIAVRSMFIWRVVFLTFSRSSQGDDHGDVAHRRVPRFPQRA